MGGFFWLQLFFFHLWLTLLVKLLLVCTQIVEARLTHPDRLEEAEAKDLDLEVTASETGRYDLVRAFCQDVIR